MAHSVESRFIAIISAALLTVVAPLFTLFLFLSSHEASKNMKNHISILLVANSQALGKPLWELDAEVINQITGTLVSDAAIHTVTVRDAFGQLDVRQHSGTSSGEADSITQQITYKTGDVVRNVGSITVSFDRIGMFSTLNQMEIAFISIFVLAVLTVFSAAIVGNRFMIMKPLMRLIAAIEATRRLGSRHHVDWRSADEMGRLAHSFNEMQIQLEQEEQELKRAHERTTEIYNVTPAMLFSLDSDDRITAVSDYWLHATGYRRDEMLDRPFVELVARSDRHAYSSRKSTRKSGATETEVTVGFLRADNSVMDVLILETDLSDASTQRNASLSVMTDVTELRRSEQRNRHQAISDHLTGLLNRQGFEFVLDSSIVAADENGSEVACMFIDLDRFKAINDNLGHAAGDAVLREFVERLRPLLKPQDSASRLGGDEFAILLTGRDIEQRALDVCEHIVAIFDNAFIAEGTSVRLSASIGLALYPAHASSAAELLQKADMAMYFRKRDGKNGSQIFDPAIFEKARQRAEMESDIEAGIARRWFEAHFQPIVTLADRDIIGFEALMRMNHPQKGVLLPGAIIEVAEETGVISQIGSLILEDAIANLARLSTMSHMSHTYVAVNFSALQFEPALPAKIASLLDRHGIHPGRLVVEITEAVLMNDSPQNRAVLQDIGQLGCRIALDDFGTGYSSLSYLNRFPVDIVKIDQSFVSSLLGSVEDVSRKSRMLVEGITTISHKMNCTVIAEGVELEEQCLLLQQMGLDCAQGNLFAHPQGIEPLMRALAKAQGARLSGIAG